MKGGQYCEPNSKSPTGKKPALTSMSFASPSLDLIRNGKRERAAQFGLTDENEESFELNQSFPRALVTHYNHHSNSNANNNVGTCGVGGATGLGKHFSPDLNRLRGCELNSVSFYKKNFLKSQQPRSRRSFLLNDTVYNTSNYLSMSNIVGGGAGQNDKSWVFYNQFLNTNALITNDDEENYIQLVNNPNKALVVINGRTSEILTANNTSCDLFGYSETTLIGMKLKDLIDLNEEETNDVDENDEKNADKKSNDKKKLEVLMEMDRLDKNGRIVICTGKIFDAYVPDMNTTNKNANNPINQNRIKMPVSMYIMKLTDEQEPKCLCAMEPIQRVVGSFAINVKGRIKYYNPNFSYIFGYTNWPLTQAATMANSSLVGYANSPMRLSNLTTSSILNGKDINELIPNMKLPMSSIQTEIRKQLLTGRTCHGENIPLTVTILNKQLYNNEEIVFNCNVSVYTNISGLFTVRTNDFKINSYNPTFSRLLLGFNDKQLIDKPITYLIPNFFDPDSNSAGPVSMPTQNTTTNDDRMIHTPLKENNGYVNNGTSGGEDMRKMNLPKFVISEPTSSMKEKVCLNCNCKLSKSRPSFGKHKSDEQLLTDFNLNPQDDYSPNKKCFNYINSNIFASSSSSSSSRSPSTVSSTGASVASSSVLTSPHSSSSLPATPHSSAVKKSLLAKAIKNNINLMNNISPADANRSMDDFSDYSASMCSLNSSTSTVDNMESGSELSASPCKPINKDTKFDLSYMEMSNLDDDQDDAAEEDDIENMMEEEDTNEPVTNVCSKCRKFMSQDDVSLLASDDDNEKKLRIKRKASSGENINNNNKNCNTNNINNQSQMTKQLSEDGVEKTKSSNDKLNTTGNSTKKFKNQVTSTPAALQNLMFGNAGLLSSSKKFKLNDGLFFGRAKHIDGSFIRVVYQTKMVHIEKRATQQGDYGEDENDTSLICVWISRDPYSDKSIIDISMDQSQFIRNNFNQTFNEANNAYSIEYEDMRCLGRGASGFVQLARRKIDQFEVVTKYILKSKIYKDNWINDQRYGNVPLEVSILCKLEHDNIIKVLEVFQDDEHIQMVMEKHGCGMDLFEFIDRQRRHIEEPLACYIFRQIVSAVSFLHSNNIVHRDIKDENIVINEKFHIKLIDFGSAAYVTKGKKFATFCGTLDYCSPDVLLGNKYFGPELDVWTCGIALYTLVFCENPFLDAEETIECILRPPFKVSRNLMKLLFSILCPKPEVRATIQEIEVNEWVTQTVNITNYKWEEVIRNTEFHSNDAGDFYRDQDLRMAPADAAPAQVAVEPLANSLADVDVNADDKENYRRFANVAKKLENNIQSQNAIILSKSF